MFDGLGKQITVGCIMLIMLIGIGNCLPDDPITIEKWQPRVFEKPQKKRPRKYKKTYGKNYSERPWVNDQKEESEEWLDFLETLENRGYTIWDPEAEDIWEDYH